MLLIDGVRYLETPPKDEDELEQMVVEHAQEIFGENSIYLDIKHKMKTKYGAGSIPDGYVVVFGKIPQWHIVEIELSSHPLHEHIIKQIGKFILGIKNPNTRGEITNLIHDEIVKENALFTKAKRLIGVGEIHRYITDCISKPPILTIIIEKKTPELEEIAELLQVLPIRIVEFRTFIGTKGDNSKHYAHMFEPLDVIPVDISFRNQILNELRREITNKRPRLKPRKPTERYCVLSVSHGVHFEWLTQGENQLGVELHLQKAKIEENSVIFESLKNKKAQIEKTVGEPLVFQLPWGRRWARIYAVREIKETPDFKLWAVDTMIKFYDVFKPMLDKL